MYNLKMQKQLERSISKRGNVEDTLSHKERRMEI